LTLRAIGVWLWGAAVIFLAVEEINLTEAILPVKIRRGVFGMLGVMCGAAGALLVFTTRV
jgi:hypothetical protein